MQQASQDLILTGTPCLQGTGTADEMALEERTTISTEGCVIADVAIVRPRGPPSQLQASASGQEGSAAPADAASGVRSTSYVQEMPQFQCGPRHQALAFAGVLSGRPLLQQGMANAQELPAGRAYLSVHLIVIKPKATRLCIAGGRGAATAEGKGESEDISNVDGPGAPGSGAVQGMPLYSMGF